MSEPIKYEDIKVEGSTYLISLVKLIGKPIKDIQGYFTKEFGDVTFKVTDLVFEDGSEMGFEGEHDLPYLVSYASGQTNFDYETLERLYEEGN